ncbi:unnamed protein product [Blepharisma stoltei]|uniref:Tim44-like domain-containing protein n=1 Tax=Blepharisma stoltei TaxID=1481888 RepID=A0AAU9IP26_9CILI|nr:unnamed protein product [Blepharisma stoltei]
MFRINQICLKFFLLLVYFQTAESRAGGGDDSSSDYSSDDSSSYDSSDSSDSKGEWTTTDSYFFLGCTFIFIILIATASIFSIDRKVDKKHKQISKKLKNAGDFIWDENLIISSVKESFIALQKAWSKQDLDFIERKLTKKLFIKWRNLLMEMRNRDERNVVSDIVVNKIKFVKLQENEKRFTVFIDAKVKDVTVNIHSGKVLKDQTGNFREFWTYVWGVDSWLLRKINQESENTKFL